MIQVLRDIALEKRQGIFLILAKSNRLYGPAIETRWRRYFPQPFRMNLGSTQPPV